MAMAIARQMEDNLLTPEREDQTFAKALLLSIAYSASIGGTATLIGTPPNLVFAGVVSDRFGVEITFARWMLLGLPLACLLLMLCWLYLTRVAYRLGQVSFPGGRRQIAELRAQQGHMRTEEKIVLAVFCGAALLWMTQGLLKPWLPMLDDTMIAMAAGILLFVLPARSGHDRILNWEEAVRLPWGIILLFGGGMALAEGFTVTGLANWIGHQLTLLHGLPILLIVVLVIFAVNFLTEITSNLATVAMLLPVLIPMAVALDVHPFLLMVGATFAGSCAFMLPVATPPNAVVFGSGHLRIPDMVRAGFWMNLISVVLVSLVAYYLLPLLWGFEVEPYPEGLRI